MGLRFIIKRGPTLIDERVAAYSAATGITKHNSALDIFVKTLRSNGIFEKVKAFCPVLQGDNFTDLMSVGLSTVNSFDIPSEFSINADNIAIRNTFTDASLDTSKRIYGNSVADFGFGIWLFGTSGPTEGTTVITSSVAFNSSIVPNYLGSQLFANIGYDAITTGGFVSESGSVSNGDILYSTRIGNVVSLYKNKEIVGTSSVTTSSEQSGDISVRVCKSANVNFTTRHFFGAVFVTQGLSSEEWGVLYDAIKALGDATNKHYDV